MASGLGYRALNIREDEFRLLVFENTENLGSDELLKCHVQHESMRRAALLPNFYAVSYTWGDVSKQSTILVGNNKIRVPRNAEVALRRCINELHRQGISQDIRPRRFYVWIDAVCLNHGDAREKSSQLSLMNAIYSEAKTVMIWLGEDEDDLAEEAVRSVWDVVGQCKAETNDLDGLFKRLWDTSARRLSIKSSSDELPPSCNLAALRSFYSSRWFTRLWVIQEACLAKHAICLKGTHTIPLYDVGLAAQWMWYRGRGKLSAYDPGTGSHVKGIRNATEIWDCMPHAYATPKLLWTILAMGMEFETTDPRDKIYGMYGLIELWLQQIPETNLRPDYDVSQAELYALATRAAILDAGNLAILSITSRAVDPNPTKAKRDPGMPSWCPRFDWTIDRFKGSTCHIQPPMRGASNGSPVRLSYIEGLEDVLTVEGLVVDEVRHTHTFNLPTSSSSSTNGGTQDTVQQAYLLASHHHSSKLNSPLDLSFARSLCAGQDSSYACITNNSDFLSHGAAFFQSSPHSNLQNLGDRITKHLYRRKDSGPGLSAVEADREVYHKALVNACQNRAFFVTREGRIGIGPLEMREEDKVCIIPGSGVPLVLRQMGVFWNLVGDAYVDGLMDGKYYCEQDAFGKLEERMECFHIQ
ncbi:uncharacterized protein LTR77_005730 [Saxophila tyrrhenica]|uniref:Heterokaryon incompatibility domain-containing protein n=1 Tax=Saxophila tyrrhenica TaxID=1690608 RepID=A0AAV9P9X6_9PEZI|nr:hypothetical protein LTR77_005730 [Saxophila tyrrhenica]